MKKPILQRIRELFGMAASENAANAGDENSTPQPRRKAMYLNLLVSLGEF